MNDTKSKKPSANNEFRLSMSGPFMKLKRKSINISIISTFEPFANSIKINNLNSLF